MVISNAFLIVEEADVGEVEGVQEGDGRSAIARASRSHLFIRVPSKLVF